MSKNPKNPTSLPDVFSTSDIARLCGVSPTTAANWIDEGKIPAHQTMGGHRRVRRADLEAFLRAYKFPIPPELEGPELAVLIVGKNPSERALMALAVHGQRPGALVLEAGDAGGVSRIARRLRKLLQVAVLVFCFAPRLDAADRDVGYGLETDLNSRYIWNGVAWSRGAVLDYSGWFSVSGWTFDFWQNQVLGDEENRGRINEFDLTLAYALKWRRLDIEPFVDHYNYPRQADSPATEMAGVTLTYPVGAVNVFTRQAWDIGEYGGASFADFGASAEKELGGKLSGKASLGLGAGSRNFNLTYLGLRKGALNHAGAELELTYRFGKGCFLRPHTEASGLLDSDLRGQVETPDLMSGGIALGWEF